MTAREDLADRLDALEDVDDQAGVQVKIRRDGVDENGDVVERNERTVEL